MHGRTGALSLSTVLRDLRRHSCSIYSYHDNIAIKYPFTTAVRDAEQKTDTHYLMQWATERCHFYLAYIVSLTAASLRHFIPVLTVRRQSRRLCRATDEPENGGSSIFQFPLLHRPRAWDQLPTEPKRTQSTSAFRRRLKTLPFNSSPTYCSE